MRNRERKIDLHIYLSEAEDRALNAKLEMSGMKSKAAFVRQLICDGFVYDIDFSEIQRNNFLLSNISNNINQIAHHINATRSIYRSDIEEVKKEMERLWQLQRSMLSSLPSGKR